MFLIENIYYEVINNKSSTIVRQGTYKAIFNYFARYEKIFGTDIICLDFVIYSNLLNVSKNTLKNNYS